MIFGLFNPPQNNKKTFLVKNEKNQSSSKFGGCTTFFCRKMKKTQSFSKLPEMAGNLVKNDFWIFEPPPPPKKN